MMLVVTLIRIVFFQTILLQSAGILIGKISGGIYIPSPSYINPPTLVYYSSSCDECLCYAINSTTTNFVAVNCLTNTRLCLFYSSYATDYSIQWNSTSYLYFFQPPPPIITTVSPQIMTSEPSTVADTSERYILITEMRKLLNIFSDGDRSSDDSCWQF